MSNDDAVRVLREIVHKPGWAVSELSYTLYDVMTFLVYAKLLHSGL